MAFVGHLASCRLHHTSNTPNGRAMPNLLLLSRRSPATRHRETLKHRPCLGTDTSGAESATLSDHANITDAQAALVGSSSNSSLTLEPSGNCSALRVFGLTHLSADPEPAEWIWQHKPSAGAHSLMPGWRQIFSSRMWPGCVELCPLPYGLTLIFVVFAVIFETAVNPSHGSQTGSVLTMSSTEDAATDFRLRMFNQIASQLSDSTSQPSSESQVWQVRAVARSDDQSPSL